MNVLPLTRVLLISMLLAFTIANADSSAKIEIPFDKFKLDNGLTVIVHEDRKAPIVAVSIWYHVGSKDEPEGKTGFAHLFEHLMFNGSENHDAEFFAPLEQVGATKVNGTTWFDRTNYFENVPTPALEMALWLESDRMGHLLGAITQEKDPEVFLNLINNARQAMAEVQQTGNLTVTSKYVINNGCTPPGSRFGLPTTAPASPTRRLKKCSSRFTVRGRAGPGWDSPSSPG